MHNHLTAVQAASAWSGALILLMIVLSIRVVMSRRRLKVLFGDGGLDEMTLVTRTFGNAAEYIPVGIGALILLALTGNQTWVIHAVGGVLLIGRLVHGFGLRFGKGPGIGRIIGMTLTWLPLLAAAAILIIRPHLP
ncbi:MAPEG family protein [Brevundimonas sp.]|uniref:MAPEG family protein n=1 Tax=Brevundimonas sp. TaxID=1871086 RepID=UPI002D7543C2|nr:MAPEG family protein [Brevundimonas sp.]HYC97768.1 MAPEG family protein [Brevundimonas sp.]